MWSWYSLYYGRVTVKAGIPFCWLPLSACDQWASGQSSLYADLLLQFTKWEIGMLWPMASHSFLFRIEGHKLVGRRDTDCFESLPWCYVWNVLQSVDGLVIRVNMSLLIILPVCPGRCVKTQENNILARITCHPRLWLLHLLPKMLIQDDVLTDCGSFIK